jgi:hypothetical protein
MLLHKFLTNTKTQIQRENSFLLMLIKQKIASHDIVASTAFETKDALVEIGSGT